MSLVLNFGLCAFCCVCGCAGYVGAVWRDCDMLGGYSHLHPVKMVKRCTAVIRAVAWTSTAQGLWRRQEDAGHCSAPGSSGSGGSVLQHLSLRMRPAHRWQLLTVAADFFTAVCAGNRECCALALVVHDVFVTTSDSLHVRTHSHCELEHLLAAAFLSKAVCRFPSLPCYSSRHTLSANITPNKDLLGHRDMNAARGSDHNITLQASWQACSLSLPHSAPCPGLPPTPAPQASLRRAVRQTSFWRL